MAIFLYKQHGTVSQNRIKFTVALALAVTYVYNRG